MAVRTLAQLKAAYAGLYADGQDDGAITPARIRAFWLDFLDSVLDDPAVLQGALDANIVTSMLRNSAVESGKIGDDAVTTAKISDGAVTGVKLAHTAGPRLVEILESLGQGNRLSADFIDDLDVPAAWALASGGSGRIPQARASATSVVSVTLSGSTVTVRTRGGATTTFDLPSGGSGGTTPAQPATFYYGLSPDATFVAGEYTAVPTSTNPRNGVLVPAPAVNSYLAFAVPDTHPDLTYISPNHATGDNQFNTFDRIAGTITLGGVAHKSYRTDTIGYPASIGREWYVY